MISYHRILFPTLMWVLIGCSNSAVSTFSPSINNLQAHEVLIMELEACHWGCIKGIVKFERNIAATDKHEIELTNEEMAELDRYFLRGKPLEEGRCSLPIIINFRLTRKNKTTSTKTEEIYPCDHSNNFDVTPIDLVRHLVNTPEQVPVWRQTKEERDKQLKIDTDDE